MRHLNLFLALSLAAALGPALAAFAQVGPQPLAPVISQLADEGCIVTDNRRSWFGRLVVTADCHGQLREIVVNRTTGAVLSDRLFGPSRSAAPDRTITPGRGEGQPVAPGTETDGNGGR